MRHSATIDGGDRCAIRLLDVDVKEGLVARAKIVLPREVVMDLACLEARRLYVCTSGERP